MTIQLTPEEEQKLKPLIERYEGFAAGVRAAMEAMKQQALKDILAARQEPPKE